MRLMPHALSESERDDVVETAQEKFLADYPDAPPTTMHRLYQRVVLNTALDYLRRKRRHERTLAKYASVLAQTHTEDAAAALARREVRSIVVKAIADQLSPAEAMIIYARFYCNKKFAEISEDLNMPISTVHSQAHKALCKLRQSFLTYKDMID